MGDFLKTMNTAQREMRALAMQEAALEAHKVALECHREELNCIRPEDRDACLEKARLASRIAHRIEMPVVPEDAVRHAAQAVGVAS